ncbi:MAG: serine/threonine-protein kinase [Acidobacteriota bacterium]
MVDRAPAQADAESRKQGSVRDQTPAGHRAPGPKRPRPRVPEFPGYRTERALGIGGMGQVFLATELGDASRRVAIKKIRSRFANAELHRRFRLERRALARLNHPNIAQLYAADTTPCGQPYVVMEFVDGAPLVEFCDRQNLSVASRLKLFLGVCRGVEHAHRRFLLHRDLKPSNLLVSDQDGQWRPKIIDFGIAKAFGDDDGAPETLTGTSAIGTPAYMSPEALRPVDGGRDLDIRTDVYSLGVVLYELLVGARPQREATDDPLLPSRILEHDAARPSSRWRDLDTDERRAAAAQRSLTPEALTSVLKALDWIVLKAIARDREQRYGSVGDLAADIERFLDHRPIEARPPSVGYRLSCFAKRQRTAIVAGTLVTLSLVVGTLGATSGMLRAQEAEAMAQAEARRASQEAETANRVSDLLVDLFKTANPEEVLAPETIRLSDLLDRGSSSVRSGLAEDPAIKARLLSVLGDIYRSMGLYGRSREHLEESLGLWEATPSPDALHLGRTLNYLAVLDRHDGHLKDAERHLKRASVLWSEALGPDHPNVAGLLNNQGNVLRELGRYREAADVLGRALEIWRDAHGPGHRSVGIGAVNLGNVWSLLGRKQEALEAYRRAGRIFTSLLGPDHPHVGTVRLNIGDALMDLGRHGEAEGAIQEGLRIRRAALGHRHPATVKAVHDLGRCRLEQGQLGDADSLLNQALGHFGEIHGPEHPSLGLVFIDLSRLHRLRGDAESARRLAQRAVDILAEERSDEEVALQSARQALQAAIDSSHNPS